MKTPPDLSEDKSAKKITLGVGKTPKGEIGVIIVLQDSSDITLSHIGLSREEWEKMKAKVDIDLTSMNN